MFLFDGKCGKRQEICMKEWGGDMQWRVWPLGIILGTCCSGLIMAIYSSTRSYHSAIQPPLCKLFWYPFSCYLFSQLLSAGEKFVHHLIKSLQASEGSRTLVMNLVAHQSSVPLDTVHWVHFHLNHMQITWFSCKLKTHTFTHQRRWLKLGILPVSAGVFSFSLCFVLCANCCMFILEVHYVSH